MLLMDDSIPPNIQSLWQQQQQRIYTKQWALESQYMRERESENTSISLDDIDFDNLKRIERKRKTCIRAYRVQETTINDSEPNEFVT